MLLWRKQLLVDVLYTLPSCLCSVRSSSYGSLLYCWRSVYAAALAVRFGIVTVVHVMRIKLLSRHVQCVQGLLAVAGMLC
jgi:hypothetical protein